MRWVEINEAEGVWTLTGERTKAGRADVVPLSALARVSLGKPREAVGTGSSRPSETGRSAGSQRSRRGSTISLPRGSGAGSHGGYTTCAGPWPPAWASSGSRALSSAACSTIPTQ